MELLLRKTSLKREDTKIIWIIMLPALFELVMSQLFGMVDTIMLGHSVDSTAAIAAVGLTNSPFNLFNGMISAFNNGTTVAVAWAMGAGKRDDACSIVRTAMMTNALIGLLVSLALYAFAEPIIIFMGAQEDTLAFAVSYLRIIAIGMLPLSMCYAITGSLRGVGRTRMPMVYNLIANFCNVIGNYALIYGRLGCPQLGVTGAAISTTLSRYVALILALGVLFFGQHEVKQTLRADWLIRLKWLKKIGGVGGTAAVEQLIMQIGFFVFARKVAGLGTQLFAAHQIALSVNGLTWMPAQAFGIAATTMVGQSLGAGEKERAEGYMRFIHRLSLLFSVCFAIVFLLFIRQIALIYTSDQDVVRLSADALRLIALGMPGIFTQLPIAAGLRGAGDSKFPLVASALGIWIFRVMLGSFFIYTLDLKLDGAWLCITLDQYARAAVVYWRFRTGKWKHKHV